jgi:predicted MFS family arabinose efflux permease
MFYYGWVIAGMGLFVKMACLGFGRFAYALLLPGMRQSLQFNYSQMGLLSGGILLGYLLFSLIGGALATKFGPRRVVLGSLVVSAASMFLLSRSSAFFLLLPCTFGMGAAAAGGHIAMTTLPMAWFGRRRIGGALGVVTGGTGLGVVITGLLLPYLLAVLGGEAWRKCWAFLAELTLMVALAGFFLLKERPAPGEARGFFEGDEAAAPKRKAPGLSLQAVYLIYFIFGFAYNIYATYFVAFMMEDVALSGQTAGSLWSLFGWMCMTSGFVWGYLSDRLGRREALFWNNGVIVLSVAIPLLFRQPFFLGLSAFLFGFTFLGTVTIVAASVGDLVVERRALVYGLVTLVHGIGQLLGTILGGWLKDLTGSFTLTLASSLAGFVLCLVLTALSRDGKPGAERPGSVTRNR